MCGICGFVGFEDQALLRKMAGLIAHRGPDDEGFYSDGTASLANRRLSIIDLDGGRQPIHNEGKTKWIVYNGELYNYRELRAQLEKKHRFYTQSDTEVIVHAFEEWGEAGVTKFNGMFAFAIWDAEKKRLFAARDHVGIKPFFYHVDARGNFVFGSEVKCVLAHPLLARKVNKLALHYLLSMMAVFGEETMFEGVKKLLPGHFLVFDANKTGGATASPRLRVERFWKPAFTHANVPFPDAVVGFRKRLENAVRRQLVSDVPVGALLSGGLDSSSIVALMARFSPRPVKTFAMGFGGSTDELDDARAVADALGTDHAEFTIDPLEAFKIYPQLIWHFDQPKVSNIYPYFVYEAVRRKVKVCLSGLGGDETAGGYVYRHDQIRYADAYNRLVPKPVRSALAALARAANRAETRAGVLELDRVKKYLRFFAYSDQWAEFYLKFAGQLPDDADLQKAYGPALAGFGERQVVDFFKRFFENDLSPQEQFLLAEFETSLTDDYLSMEDAMSMANSLEVRVPFLDVDLVDYSLSLPFDFKYRNGVGKIILRRAMKDALPERVFTKPKAGFGPSFFEWYSRGVRPLAEQVLDDPVIAKKGFVDKTYVKKVMDRPLNSLLNRHYLMLQSLVGFEVWYNLYFERADGGLEKPSMRL